jgi:hypothetical protein
LRRIERLNRDRILPFYRYVKKNAGIKFDELSQFSWLGVSSDTTGITAIAPRSQRIRYNVDHAMAVASLIGGA